MSPSGQTEVPVTSKTSSSTGLIAVGSGRVLRSLWLRLCVWEAVGRAEEKPEHKTDGMGGDLSQKEGTGEACIRAA